MGNVHEGNGSVDHIGQLKPDTRNPRKHNPRNIGMIVDSLHHVGAARSIVIDEDDNILAGNGVVEAAAQAGIERVRVVEADGQELIAVRRRGLTQEQRQKLKYYDNQTGAIAEWDAGRIAADISQGMDLKGIFDAQELADIMASVKGDPPEDPGPQIDRAAELQEQWKTELGQLWELGEHRLICGDCTDRAVVERVMGGERAILMVTDPPYGVEYDPNWRNVAAAEGKLAYAARRIGEVYNDDRTDWSEAWHLFSGDVIYTWSPPGDHVILTGQSLQRCGFEIRNMVIWRKPHFPISRGHYTYQHEPCWYAVRKGAQAHWIGPANASTVWEVALDKNCEGGHSTQKPLRCMSIPIENHDSALIYDPFLGSGTTLIACERLGRKCRAIEISPAYVAVSLQRWADMTGRSPVLVD